MSSAMRPAGTDQATAHTSIRAAASRGRTPRTASVIDTREGAERASRE